MSVEILHTSLSARALFALSIHPINATTEVQL